MSTKVRLNLGLWGDSPPPLPPLIIWLHPHPPTPCRKVSSGTKTTVCNYNLSRLDLQPKLFFQCKQSDGKDNKKNMWCFISQITNIPVHLLSINEQSGSSKCVSKRYSFQQYGAIFNYYRFYGKLLLLL